MADVLLFGDQTGLSYDFLNDALLKTQQSPLANAFLTGSAKTLRQEIAHLSSADREDIPRFTTIQDLVQNASKHVPAHPAIEGSLTTISQFIHFISHYEDHPVAYPAAETHVLGLCIGSLAAAAVASSHSLSELLPLAVHSVGIAFRIGLEARETASHLSASTNRKDAWAHVLHGVDKTAVDLELDDFNSNTGNSQSGRPYVSAVGPNTVTISGSPLLLNGLIEASTVLRKAVRLSLPLHAPYHAPSLYETVDVSSIIYGNQSSALETAGHQTSWLPLYSTSTGQKFAKDAVSGLLTHVVREILRETLRWDLVLVGCVSDVAASHVEAVNVLAFGPTKAAKNLVSAFQTSEVGQASLQDTASWIKTARSESQECFTGFQDTKIAIVGLAGRFPGGSDHEAFWSVLEQGLDVHKEIPTDRFDVRSHVDPDGKQRNTSHTPYGCFIDNPGYFDPRFFNMSPREAAQTDPMQRLALVTAYEALEMAGYVPNRTASTTLDRVGTFYGQTSDDYREMNASQNVDTYFITGGIRAFGPGRINYHFKFSGPSFNIDTACSSSLAAIQLACTSLWSGDCDTAVAGGLSVLTSPDLYAGLSRGQFLSKTGSCKTFDNAADGYCRSDSIGTVILKRLDDAIADNDNVLGVILAAATNHSADAISITHPHAQTQEHLYRKILAQAGIGPLDVNVAEMHGTGTQAGDGAEMESISNVLAPEIKGRNANNPLYVGSVKANVGHGEAASGVTALIKSLLMLQKDTIPPHAGIKGLINQTFPNLERRNIRIATSKTPFKARNNNKRRLLVNNFSAAGGNTALLLEDYVRPKDSNPDVRPVHIVVVSAKSKQSVTQNIERLVSYLDNNPYTSLPSLSYTTTARRIQHDLRVAAIGTDVFQIKESLRSVQGEVPVLEAPKLSKIAFAFTGQGSYYASLGKDLYRTSKHFRSRLDHLDGLSGSYGHPSFLPAVNNSTDDNPPLSPAQTQLLLVSIQMALSSLWASWGIVPEIVIGHSLGEYAALNAAGVLSASDVIFLVGHRARLLKANCKVGTHSIFAIRARKSVIQGLLVEKGLNLEIACINGPSDVVLSGESSEIEAALPEFVGLGHKCTKLEVPYAFYSSQVDPILEPFEKLARSISFHTPRLPVISPLLGTVVDDADILTPSYLSRHAREPVDFDSALHNAQQRGLISDLTGWVEIGPHPVCLGMIKRISRPTFSVASLRRDEDAWVTLAGSAKDIYLHGLDIDWSEYHRDFSHGYQLLNLPSYAFEEKNYWLEYKNNWSLTKGGPAASTVEETLPTFSTTSLQRIVSEEFQDDKASVVFESDFSEASLHAAVTGHLVNDTGLCPSSIYADIALTAANYIYQRLLPSSPEPGMNVRAMEVS